MAAHARRRHGDAGRLHTHHCIDSSARQAMHAGFAVEIIADATGMLSLANEHGKVSAEQLFMTVQAVMHTQFAAVTDTDEWLRVLDTGEAIRRGQPARVRRMTRPELPSRPAVRRHPPALDGRAATHYAWVAAAVSIVLWATAFPAIPVAVADYDPMILTAVRLLVASAALLLAAPFLKVIAPRARDLPLIVLSGLLGMAGYQLLLNWGEQTVSGGDGNPDHRHLSRRQRSARLGGAEGAANHAPLRRLGAVDDGREHP